MTNEIEMWAARDDLPGQRTDTFLFQHKPDMVQLAGGRVTYMNRGGLFVRVAEFLQIERGECLLVKLAIQDDTSPTPLETSS